MARPAGLPASSCIGRTGLPITKNCLLVGKGDKLVTCTGGGGYGDPRARDTQAVRDDVREGKVSAKIARDVYGLS